MHLGSISSMFSLTFLWQKINSGGRSFVCVISSFVSMIFRVRDVVASESQIFFLPLQ